MLYSSELQTMGSKAWYKEASYLLLYILSILSLHCVNGMKIESNLKMFDTDIVEKNETDILCLLLFLFKSYNFEIIKQK
jgi:hypothetical protein